MADELHLVERVVDRHRLGLMLLGADHPARLVLPVGAARVAEVWRLDVVEGRLGIRQDRGGGGQRNRGLVAVVDFATIFHAPQPAFQLGDRGFEGGIETVGAGLAADYRPTTASGDLDVLARLALATVALVVEFDIEQVDGSVESLQAGEFLRDVDAEVVGNFDVATFDDDLGVCRRFVFVDVDRTFS